MKKTTGSSTRATPKSGSDRSKITPISDSEISDKSYFSIDDPCSKNISEKWGARTTKKRKTAFTSPFMKDLSSPKKARFSPKKRKALKEKFKPTLEAINEVKMLEKISSDEEESEKPIHENLENFKTEPLQKKIKIEITNDEAEIETLEAFNEVKIYEKISSDKEELEKPMHENLEKFENDEKNDTDKICDFNYKDALPNGLFDKPNYYMQPSDKNYKIGKYDINGNKLAVLCHRDYITMQKNKWLTGEIVDLLMRIREQPSYTTHYEKFYYIDHLITKQIFSGLKKINNEELNLKKF